MGGGHGPESPRSCRARKGMASCRRSTAHTQNSHPDKVVRIGDGLHLLEPLEVVVDVSQFFDLPKHHGRMFPGNSYLNISIAIHHFRLCISQPFSYVRIGFEHTNFKEQPVFAAIICVEYGRERAAITNHLNAINDNNRWKHIWSIFLQYLNFSLTMRTAATGRLGAIFMRARFGLRSPLRIPRVAVHCAARSTFCVRIRHRTLPTRSGNGSVCRDKLHYV